MWPPGTPSDEDEAAPSGGFPFEAAEDAANRARRPLVKARVEQNTDRGQRAPELIARPDGSSGDRMHIDDGPHAHASAGPGLLAAPLVDFQTPQMPAQVPRDHVFPGGGPVGRPAPPTENSPRGSFYEPVGALNAADQQTRHQATRPFNVGSVSGQAGPFHGTVSRQRADPFLLATPRAGSSAHASQESAAPEGGPASDSALDSSILSATAFGRLPAKCPKENGCAGCMEALKGCQGMAPVEAYVVLKGAKATVHRADNNQLIEDSGCELSRHYGEHHERLHRIPCTKPDPLPGTNAKAEDGHKDAVGDWCPFTPPNPQQCLLCNPELQPNPRASKAGDHKYARGLLGNPANIRCHLSGAEHCGRNHLKCSKCELEVSTQANLVAHWKKKHTEEEGNAPARRSTSQSKRAFHEVDQPNDDQAAAEDHDGSEDTEWQPRKRKQARSEPAAHEAGPASGKRRALGPPAKTQAAKPGPLADLAANPAEFFALDGSFRADSPTPASGVAPQRVPGFAVQQQMELASAPEFNSSTFGNRVPGRVHVQFESQFLRNVSFGSPSARLGPNQIDYSLSYSVGIPGYEQQASAAAGADGLASPICETGHAIFDITDNTGATNNFRTFSSARPVLQGHNHLSADTFARFDAGPASAAGPSGATWEGESFGQVNSAMPQHPIQRGQLAAALEIVGRTFQIPNLAAFTFAIWSERRSNPVGDPDLQQVLVLAISQAISAAGRNSVNPLANPPAPSQPAQQGQHISAANLYPVGFYQQQSPFATTARVSASLIPAVVDANGIPPLAVRPPPAQPSPRRQRSFAAPLTGTGATHAVGGGPSDTVEAAQLDLDEILARSMRSDALPAAWDPEPVSQQASNVGDFVRWDDTKESEQREGDSAYFCDHGEALSLSPLPWNPADSLGPRESEGINPMSILPSAATGPGCQTRFDLDGTPGLFGRYGPNFGSIQAQAPPSPDIAGDDGSEEEADAMSSGDTGSHAELGEDLGDDDSGDDDCGGDDLGEDHLGDVVGLSTDVIKLIDDCDGSPTATLEEFGIDPDTIRAFGF